jgi:transaldolase
MITVTEATATAGALERLSDEGVSIWLDDLSRRRIESGNLAEQTAWQDLLDAITKSINSKGVDAE